MFCLSTLTTLASRDSPSLAPSLNHSVRAFIRRAMLRTKPLIGDATQHANGDDAKESTRDHAGMTPSNRRQRRRRQQWHQRENFTLADITLSKQSTYCKSYTVTGDCKINQIKSYFAKTKHVFVNVWQCQRSQLKGVDHVPFLKPNDDNSCCCVRLCFVLFVSPRANKSVCRPYAVGIINSSSKVLRSPSLVLEC